jgi:MAX-like protein X
MLNQLFDTYNRSVSTADTDTFYQSVLAWCDQYCSLTSLRPIVMNSLKELSIKTSILSDPSKVPEQMTDYSNS